LLEALRTGEAVDLIRESVRMVMQELIDAEATELIGAARHEHTESRTNERNGRLCWFMVSLIVLTRTNDRANCIADDERRQPWPARQ